MERQTFLTLSTGTVGGLCLHGCRAPNGNAKEPFRLSLAQWSLNKQFFGRVQPKLDNLDFAKTAREFGIDAIEYVNKFFMDKATDKKYLAEMKKRAKDNGYVAIEFEGKQANAKAGILATKRLLEEIREKYTKA